MRLFDNAIDDIDRLIEAKGAAGQIRRLETEIPHSWPRAGRNNVILKAQTGLELGGPDSESLSFVIWTNNPTRVSDNTIHLVGNDLSELGGGAHPLGRVVILAGTDFGPENIHDRFRELDLKRLEVSLEGYMVRAVSREMKEWSRISHQALADGFSFSTLGSALLEKYREPDYITAAELLFITASAEDVRRLRPVAKTVAETVGAIRKMVEELSVDCANCEFQRICREMDDLKQLKKSLTASR